MELVAVNVRPIIGGVNVTKRIRPATIIQGDEDCSFTLSQATFVLLAPVTYVLQNEGNILLNI